MLPKNHRLPRQEFLSTKKTGINYSTKYFNATALKALPHTKLFTPRFSVVTPSKLSKSAVVRNRLRRRIYNSLKDTSYKPQASVIIYPKPAVLDLTRAQICSEVNFLISKIYS